MEKNEIAKKIKEAAKALGADVCGIGDISRFSRAPEGFSPLDLYDGCRSVIAVGMALPKGLYKVEPRLLYGSFNAEICTRLDDLELLLARYIEDELGGICVPVPCDAPNEYWEPETRTAKGLISMKYTAALCGLGSIGKSSLLINEKYGNRLTIGAILTDLELPSDPISPELCIKGCSKCVESYPVGAIKDGRVNQLLCRANTYGKTARGFDTVDCNICRTVCPMATGRPFE